MKKKKHFINPILLGKLNYFILLGFFTHTHTHTTGLKYTYMHKQDLDICPVSRWGFCALLNGTSPTTSPRSALTCRCRS